MNNSKNNLKNINNRFSVHAPLGEGGFGKVLLVYDNEVDEYVP